MFDNFNLGYLVASDLQTVMAHSRYALHMGDGCEKLKDFNVVAVNQMGVLLLFKIIPPDRNVECYSYGNDIKTTRDVVEVFSLIQNTCIAWCEV